MVRCQLSHICPVWMAAEILGRPTVERLVSGLIRLRQSGGLRSSVSSSVSYNNNNNSNLQQSVALQEEIDNIVEAIFYRHPPLDAAEDNPPLPPHIAQAWKRLTTLSSMASSARNQARASPVGGASAGAYHQHSQQHQKQQQQSYQGNSCYAIESKHAWVQFLVPAAVQPHTGPAGHQGLFDCWMYALQAHAPSSQASYYGGAASQSVYLVDILILLAICLNYQRYQQHQQDVYQQDVAAQQQQQQQPKNQQPLATSQETEQFDPPEAPIYLEGNERNETLLQGESDDAKPTSEDRDHELEEKKLSAQEDEAPDVAQATTSSKVAEATTTSDPEHNGSMESLQDPSPTKDSLPARNESDSWRDEKVILTMALLAYRIYDSYQKKGEVTRDTVHRFLTDVHGEESYKEPSVAQVLNVIFADFASGYLHATVTEIKFCKRIVRTMSRSKTTGRPTHVLLDWIAILGCAMMPSPEIPLSVTAYLDAMSQTPRPVTETFDLAEARLYEIKRRFHSVVQTHSPAIIQGDPMGSSGAAADMTDSGADVVAGSSSNVSPPQPQQSQGGQKQQAISVAAWCDAVSMPKEDMGYGGYLPRLLARLIFDAGYRMIPDGSGAVDYADIYTGDDMDYCNGIDASATSPTRDRAVVDESSLLISNAIYCSWTLQHVLQFGCMAVRLRKGRSTSISNDYNNNNNNNSISALEHADVPLLRFLFRTFQRTTADLIVARCRRRRKGIKTTAAAVENSTVTATSNPDKQEDAGDQMDGDFLVPVDRRVLTRPQVARMVLHLVNFTNYRLKVDQPLNVEDKPAYAAAKEQAQDLFDAETWNRLNDDEGGDQVDLAEGLSVDAVLVARAHLLPKKHPALADLRKKMDTSSSPAQISVKTIVDAILMNTAEADQMNFNEFCIWNQVDPVDKSKSFEGPLSKLMMECRLIASVLFGIPPTQATLEAAVVDELICRHSQRYPQTDVSRRGPRGTVWYLIDFAWYKQWNDYVGAVVSSSQEDTSDGRGRGPIKMSARVRALGRISNTALLVDNGSLALRPDIRWRLDYDIIPPAAWSALQAWYDGGPPIYRTVVRYVPSAAVGGAAAGATNPHTAKMRIPTENEIELYPLFVRIYLCDAASRGQARPFQQNYQLSRVSPVGLVLVQLCKELGVDPDFARLWVMGSPAAASSSNLDMDGSIGSITGGEGSATEDWILNLDMNILDQRKQRRAGSWTDRWGGISLLLEIKDKESNRWPRGSDGKEWAFGCDKSSSTAAIVKDDSVSDLGDGIVGLYNMGNTCYMNASIQCLSHTPIFREYFTSKFYLKDINTTNPIGHKGELAQVSAILINSLWKRFGQNSAAAAAGSHQPRRIMAPGSYALVNAPSLTPKTFKESLGRFNEHFQGNEQHDAQEVLAFLLGGLSEDLNRIVDKPYIDAPDSDGRPERELADIWWSNHLKRELSIIVALFTGQYKSLLTCRTCKYQSARFEPFSFLQLPLPEDDHYSVYVVLYPLTDGADTLKYCVRVRNDGKLRDVLIALSKTIHADQLEATGAEAKELQAESENRNLQEEFYRKMAQNYVVVDVRDGYISKIAPNSWALQDLQNKDTGELPPIHVYELDPLPPPDGERKSEGGAANSTEAENFKKPRQAFLAIAQRRSEVISRDFLHPLAHRVFGTPILLRVHNLEQCTGCELYDLVAKRLKNVVPRAAWRFLAKYGSRHHKGAHDAGTQFSNTASSGRLKIDQYTNRTTTDMEEVSAGPMPRYGFRLRLTTRDGRRCLTCPWYECCIGCLVPDDDQPTVAMDSDSLVVDWHFAVDVATSGFGMRSNMTNSPALLSSSSINPTTGQPPQTRLRNTGQVVVKNHASCGTGSKRSGLGSVITLEECLDAFAEEERIPEAYCSKCKDFRVQTKRMSLWRLPPIVIIHLKRFQFTQHLRRKLRDLVIFPIEGLDLSRIMAKEALQFADSMKENGRSVVHAEGHDGGDVEPCHVTNGDDDEPPTSTTEAATTSATRTTEEECMKDNSSPVMLYDLYGVVHHQGALSGGHYVASLKSELDGQWRLFNDAQIYEIHSRDVVDGSAYILFYIRRDVQHAKLSDFWSVPSSASSGSLSEEDMQQWLKGRGSGNGGSSSDRCVIS